MQAVIIRVVVLLQSFPSSIIGSAFNFEAGTFFKLDSEAERVVPRVEMS